MGDLALNITVLPQVQHNVSNIKFMGSNLQSFSLSDRS